MVLGEGFSPFLVQLMALHINNVKIQNDAILCLDAFAASGMCVSFD